MTEALAFRCEDHESPFACPDALLVRSPSGEIGLIVHDGGTSCVGISYCPWCASPLTPTQRPWQAVAIVRVDSPEATSLTGDITVKEVIASQALADQEVERLNRVNADKSCHYCSCPTRVFRAGSAGGPE